MSPATQRQLAVQTAFVFVEDRGGITFAINIAHIGKFLDGADGTTLTMSWGEVVELNEESAIHIRDLVVGITGA